MSASSLHYRRLRGGLKASTKVCGHTHSLQNLVRGDRVAFGLVADQDAAKIVAGRALR